MEFVRNFVEIFAGLIYRYVMYVICMNVCITVPSQFTYLVYISNIYLCEMPKQILVFETYKYAY